MKFVGQALIFVPRRSSSLARVSISSGLVAMTANGLQFKRNSHKTMLVRPEKLLNDCSAQTNFNDIQL